MGPTGLSHLSIVTHAKSLLCTSQLLLNQYLGDLSSSLIRVLSSAALRCLSPIPNGIVSSYYLCTSGHFNLRPFGSYSTDCSFKISLALPKRLV